MTTPTKNLVRVLLADDDEEDYILTKHLFDDFKDGRYKLEWTADGKKTLESMKSEGHDVYLVDYRMGEFNGLEIIRKAVALGCTAPIILLTGQGDKEVDFKAQQAGAADYVVKGELTAVLLERVIRYSLQHARTLEKMQSSEAKFRSVIESASDAIFLVNDNGKITLWNKAAEDIFGYSEEEILGRPAVLLMGEKYAIRAVERGLQKTLRNILAPMSGQTIEATGRRRDKSEFPLELAGSISNTNTGFFYTAIIRDITDRKKADESLRESEERYRDLFENANDTIYIHDLEGNFLSVNQTGTKVLGYSREEALKLSLADVIVPEHLEFATSRIAAKIDGNPTSSYEIDCFGKDGRRVSFEINSRIVHEDNEPVAVQGIARDITDRKQAEAERDRLYNVSNDLLATIGFDGALLHINPAWANILGYDADKLLGILIYDIIHEEDREQNSAVIEKLKSGENITTESRLVCKDGSFRWILWNLTPVVSEEISYAVGHDITERKRAEDILQQSAMFDSLTNLPNRANFINHLEKAIVEFRQNPSKGFAVLFLDIDRFKIVNDGLGHLVGDKLLISIAERIKSRLRPGDIVARLGGDEFTLLVHNVEELAEVTKVAERIQESLLKPFRLDNYEVSSSASIGIIISDDSTRKPEDFLRDADSAMYRAKELGKSRYEIFDYEMHIRNMNLLQTETDLRRAIEREEFRVFYQPIVCLETGKIVEIEALVRWQHPELGLVFPDEFILIAEETGLIIPIGEWVLEESCKQTKLWVESLSNLDKLSVSVNLSTKQLMYPNMASIVTEILGRTELDPQHLKLEVTESTVMEDGEMASKVMYELRSIGVDFSIDDFGTGYSSLSYLHQFPFKRIKIDRSFIGKMDEEVKSQAIVRTILMLGNSLGMEVVAEGIENATQCKQLRMLGCSLGQGYLFSKPVGPEDTGKLLRNEDGKGMFETDIDLLTEANLRNVLTVENSQ